MVEMANLSSEIQLSISQNPQTTNQELFQLLQPIHSAINLITQYLDGINPQAALIAATVPTSTLRTSAVNRMVVKANGNLTEGLPVFFSLVAGVLQATVAQASAANVLAMGFCSQPGGVVTGAYGEFTPAMGLAKGSFALGTKYYLQNGGGYGAAPGTINQCLGVAISTTQLLFFLGIPQ